LGGNDFCILSVAVFLLQMREGIQPACDASTPLPFALSHFALHAAIFPPLDAFPVLPTSIINT
jgi:hypothetical protein